MEKIRVLHLIKTLNLGGAEKNLYNLVNSFNSNRVETHVGFSYGGEFEEEFRKSGVRLFRFSDTKDKIKSLKSFSIIFQLVKFIIANRIQIIHTHCFSTLIWGAIAAKLTGRKLLEHVHDSRYVDLHPVRIEGIH